MMRHADEVRRIIEDFGHGKQLGERSTRRLLNMLLRLADRVDTLEDERRTIEVE
jgi:hypothetical protein